MTKMKHHSYDNHDLEYSDFDSLKMDVYKLSIGIVNNLMPKRQTLNYNTVNYINLAVLVLCTSM
jgi:hypothetical protein